MPKMHFTAFELTPSSESIRRMSRILLGLFLAVVVPAYVTARKEGNSVLWASGVGLAYGFGTFGALFAVIYAIVRIIAWRESRQTLPDVPPAPEKNR